MSSPDTERLEPPPPPAVNARGAALVVIASLASVWVLHWASAVFVSLLLSLALSCALMPLMDRLVRLHVPRALAAALLVLGVVGGGATLVYSLSDDAVAMVEALPEAARKLQRRLQTVRHGGPVETIDRVQKVAAELERAAADVAVPAPGRKVTQVQIVAPRFSVRNYLWPSAVSAVAAAGQTLVVLFLAFFLLASGDRFRRKFMHMAGPTLGRRKLTLQALDEIQQQIQRYLMVQVFTSAVVGVTTWLAFLWIGVDNAAVWGLASFVLNFIPYLGGVVVTSGAALLGFVQFGSFEMAALIGGTVLVINCIEGYALSPWLTGRASRMNPVAVFVGVLAWGWLWGIAGLFLGVPLLMVMKAVFDRVDDLNHIGELLGE